MNEKIILSILGSSVLISIIILGIFSLKTILFSNKIYKKQEINEEINEAINKFTPTLDIKTEAPKKTLEIIDYHIKTIKELEMKEINTIITEKILYQKLKTEENFKKKIELLKIEEQQNCLIAYLEIIKKHINDLSDKEIDEMLKYIEINF